MIEGRLYRAAAERSLRLVQTQVVVVADDAAETGEAEEIMNLRELGSDGGDGGHTQQRPE